MVAAYPVLGGSAASPASSPAGISSGPWRFRRLPSLGPCRHVAPVSGGSAACPAPAPAGISPAHCRAQPWHLPASASTQHLSAAVTSGCHPIPAHRHLAPSPPPATADLLLRPATSDKKNSTVLLTSTNHVMYYYDKALN